MKKLIGLLATVALGFATGCENVYDDSELRGSVDDLKDRVENLETQVRTMNADIATIRSIVAALQQRIDVLRVEPTLTGYRIYFTDGTVIDLNHGTNGKDGENGKDGADGKDGVNGKDGADGKDGVNGKDGADGKDGVNGKDGADGKDGVNGKDGADGKDGVNGKDGVDGKDAPVIGVKKDTDGIYYWTLTTNGHTAWLLDDQGNKLRVTGRDGTQGGGNPTPLLGIDAQGYWTVSYDGGKTSTRITDTNGNPVKATGDTQSVIASVTQDDACVYITLADGTVITLPKTAKFDLVFAQQEGLVCEPGSSVQIAYTIVGGDSETVVECIGKEGWMAEVEPQSPEKGHIAVTAPTGRSNGKVLVFASSGAGQTVMKSLTFGAGILTGIADAYQIKPAGGKLSIRVTTNLDYTVHVDDDAAQWIAVTVTRAELRNETLTVTVQPNASETERTGYFELRGAQGTMLQRVEVIQTPKAQPIKGDIEFADATVKAACVAKFDTDGDGEVSYAEAAAVTKIEHIFSDAQKKKIISFDELQYFTSLKSIHSTFSGCTSLRSVVLPEGLLQIGGNVFNQCTHLQSIRIPDSVQEIYDQAFYNCTMLAEIQLPKSLMSINREAFSGCRSIMELDLPELVSSIRGRAFENCEKLQRITIPDGVFEIEYNTFAGCSSLSEVILPRMLRTIEQAAFQNCKNLTKISLPQSVTQISAQVFENCSSLTQIDLPRKLQSIDFSTFSGCSNLKSIILPEAISKIPNYLFANCLS